MRIRIRGVALTFALCSFLGWIADSAYRSLYAGELVLRGPTWPPFYPSYGIGALLLCVAVRQLRAQPLGVRALAYAAVATAWELVAGLVLAYGLGLRLWDYSGNPFQFLGLVDLEHALCWLLLGLLFEVAVYPRVAGAVFTDAADAAPEPALPQRADAA